MLSSNIRTITPNESLHSYRSCISSTKTLFSSEPNIDVLLQSKLDAASTTNVLQHIAIPTNLSPENGPHQMVPRRNDRTGLCFQYKFPHSWKPTVCCTDQGFPTMQIPPKQKINFSGYHSVSDFSGFKFISGNSILEPCQVINFRFYTKTK